MAAGSARPSVEKIGGCVERVGPERERHAGMDEHGASAVIEGAQDPFGTAVLLGSVGTGETQNDVACGQEGAERGVVELATIVSLERHDRPPELSLHKSIKGNECGEHIGLPAKWERPDVMRVIVKHYKIVLEA